MDLYRKFQESGQESVRLRIALDCFFSEQEPQRRETYGRYLKRRILPAAETLLRDEAFEKLEALYALDWIGLPELDRLLRRAEEDRLIPGFLWLLQKKKENFGFPDRDFAL